ncbi:MAG: hypothetical protein M9952_12530 [Microthrixaceae bacterium]|nr:hypothetical protein [Microthrixaceae bacterium]MCO5313748.1 hypothetical protein [Microthrixaceae bacterium]HPB45213.1 hypothetical protein [Microthrixaceae bacterium]
MSWFVERRLRSVAQNLRSARDDLAVTDEQLDQLVDEAEDAALRSIVSDDRSAVLDSNDAIRHRDALVRHRQGLVDKIASLEARQDELLDEMNQRRSGRS